MTLACLFLLHDYRPVPITGRWLTVCAGCGKETPGVVVGEKPLAFVKPKHRWKRQSEWYQRLGIQRRKVYDKPLREVRKRA